MSSLYSRLQELWNPNNFKKLVLMLLLVLQIGFQPVLIGWYANEETNANLRVAVIEFFKFILAFLPLFCTGTISNCFKAWNLRRALQTTAVPALIYVLQNYLNQTAVVVLDGLTFNVLNQTKIIWTALLVYFMLRRQQSREQMFALGLLCIAAVLMTTRPQSSGQDTPATSHRREDVSDEQFLLGAYRALIAAMLSALAGTIIQRALQAQKRDACVVTMELSILGEISLLVWTFSSGSSFISNPPVQKTTSFDTNDTPQSLWHGWTFMTFFALFCQAMGGVIVGFVIKYCGNVEKSFAVVGGMIITALLESQYNNIPFGIHGGIAILLVIMSTFLYTLYPPTHVEQAPIQHKYSHPSRYKLGRLL